MSQAIQRNVERLTICWIAASPRINSVGPRDDGVVLDDALADTTPRQAPAKGLPRQLVFPAQEHAREESGSERENGALLKEV